MSVHRFYLPPEQCQGPALVLAGREAHHALEVLRVGRDERVTVLDGAGQECLCEIEERRQGKVGLRVIERRLVPAPPYQITLVQALPKGKIIESIIQKGTELGVHRVVPLLSERVVAKLDEDEAVQKGEKWQLIAVEAIKQCGSAWLPRVERPLTLKALLARKDVFELTLVGSLQAGSRHPREYFREYHRQRGSKPATVCVWVGPEGDFTPEELGMIQGSGALPITLGRLVLRSETAALYCLSVVNYELQSPAD